jgi:hypothetical protein
MLHRSCEPTYEELKLAYPKEAEIKKIVASLPMRN